MYYLIVYYFKYDYLKDFGSVCSHSTRILSIWGKARYDTLQLEKGREK